MKNNFDIGITTFSLRFDFVKNLITKIRELGVENNIYLCINGEKNSDFKDSYRKDILKLCEDNSNVYPIFFVEMRGLSKLWNSLIIHSTKDDVLILNDDIILESDHLFRSVSEHIQSKQYFGLSKINNTFSYFVINKSLINDLGYFDERLLGFGEEDGDITYRLIKQKGVDVYNLYAQGIQNIVSDIRHEHVKKGIGKYSFFNRDFIFNKKYNCQNAKSGISGMFGVVCDTVLDDLNLYPYESFFKENKNKL